MKHILCYGDSNTWGFQPGFGGRYPRQRRWTGVAEGLLGDGYVLLENGLNGRTTDFDDPELPYRNGRKGFAYAMVSQKPIDLLLLMLGTNDLKFTTAEGSRDGLASILEEALHPEIHFPSGSSPVYTGKPRVLLLSPIRMRPGTVFDRPCGGPKDPAAESERFAPLFRRWRRRRAWTSWTRRNSPDPPGWTGSTWGRRPTRPWAGPWRRRSGPSLPGRRERCITARSKTATSPTARASG